MVYQEDQVMRLQRPVFSFVATLAMASCAVTNKNDVRAQCVFSSGELCRVPYEAVLSSRKRFDEVLISVDGVLSVESESIYVYPNLESKKFSIRSKALEIRGSIERIEVAKFLDGKYVTVVGRFRVGDADNWGVLDLALEPHEIPEPFDANATIPAAPPPPRSREW